MPRYFPLEPEDYPKTFAQMHPIQVIYKGDIISYFSNELCAARTVKHLGPESWMANTKTLQASTYTDCTMMIIKRGTTPWYESDKLLRRY